MTPPPWHGPQTLSPAGLHPVAAGVWLTGGRAAVVEGRRALAVIDPGDEAAGSSEQPRGPLADVLTVVRHTAKPVEWILLTHGHPDHVANLSLFQQCFPASRVVAHADSPLAGDDGVAADQYLDAVPGLQILTTPGHSPWGDDLSFYCHDQQLLFSGDLIQPKGESWEDCFYPSPYPFFRDGGQYLASLRKLQQLPFAVLVTGHRETRHGAAARQWLELTVRAISSVEQAVRNWTGDAALQRAAPQIWAGLATERGLPAAVRTARLDGGDQSAFARFDLPGIAHFWHTCRGSAG